MTRPVLVAPDLNKEFRVEADASNYATRGVLSMKCLDGLQRPVAFISKSLSDIERNYEIYDKKILVIVRCLEVWRHFLEEVITKFKIQIDCYETTPKKETISHTFINLIGNIQEYNTGNI